MTATVHNLIFILETFIPGDFPLLEAFSVLAVYFIPYSNFMKTREGNHNSWCIQPGSKQQEKLPIIRILFSHQIRQIILLTQYAKTSPFYMVSWVWTHPIHTIMPNLIFLPLLHPSHLEKDMYFLPKLEPRQDLLITMMRKS